jgi:hypothetical protein
MNFDPMPRRAAHGHRVAPRVVAQARALLAALPPGADPVEAVRRHFGYLSDTTARRIVEAANTPE